MLSAALKRVGTNDGKVRSDIVVASLANLDAARRAPRNPAQLSDASLYKNLFK